MADLIVQLYGHTIGTLRGADWRSFDFVIDRGAFEHFQLGSTVLSEAVPLELVQTRGRADRRRNFFSELLPEGSSLEDLARRARVDPSNTIGMLSAYGRDVAGAVQIWDPDDPEEPRTPRTEALTIAQVEAMLLDLGSQPLGNKPLQGKSSLAGVQPKAVVALIDGTWHQVLDGYPSNHIIKPELEKNPTVIFDEEYGSRFVRALGLAAYDSRIVEFKSVAGLVIERYDRSSSIAGGRIHQEDMNQALGARQDAKYQERGSGQMSLSRIARIFSERGDTDSLRRLLRANVLAVSVGNLDLHGKNLSILHLPDGSASLAPVYDMVPLTHHADLDGRMAMAINGQYPHAAITAEDLIEEGVSWGLRNAGRVVELALESILDTVGAQAPDARSWAGLGDDIAGFTLNLLEGRAAGRPASSAR
ncbi:type II toxin-antitoxin system HipA family toxin [Glaciihabitans sp. dw_435]|uniref:type II toxin-antitoxin system HipA family toxin n=1 Tax=Glaciihabitans sp. dw_435 TaxID=2720081 RepID=UPI001BD42076|nr:HipA domain-containing protein [Glaciihabitans sp. dw_435]